MTHDSTSLGAHALASCADSMTLRVHAPVLGSRHKGPRTQQASWPGGISMTLTLKAISVAVAALAFAAVPAAAQKQGGTLRIYHRDNPPSASILEEATVSV